MDLTSIDNQVVKPNHQASASKCQQLHPFISVLLLQRRRRDGRVPMYVCVCVHVCVCVCACVCMRIPSSELGVFVCPPWSLDVRAQCGVSSPCDISCSTNIRPACYTLKSRTESNAVSCFLPLLLLLTNMFGCLSLGRFLGAHDSLGLHWLMI